MEIKGGNQAFSKDDLLKELQSIESHDAELISDTADLYEIPLEIEKKEFFNAYGKITQQKYSTFRQIHGFAFVSAVISLSLLSAFFIYKGFVAKNEGMEKSIIAYERFMSAEQNLKSFNFSGAEEGFIAAYENLASAEKSINEIGNLTVAIAENIPFNSKPESSISLLRAAKHIAKAGEIISSAFASSPFGAISTVSFLGTLAGKDENPAYRREEFNVFTYKISLAETELLMAKDAMQGVNSADFPEEFQADINDLNSKIPSLLNIAGLLGDYSEISSFLFGLDAPKRYLILFQNSSELRPTGGFIGSYAVINVEGGKLKDMFVDGIYNADGQLTVNVIPPKPFEHIATAWSTHDANWFLDFPTSAEKIMWFYERTGGGKVDGVISINVEVIEQLLSLTGPISLPQYALILDSQNFRDEIQYEVEVGYDKKLNRPKQVLSDFTPIFLERLFEILQEKNKEIFADILWALEHKHIMLYSSDKKAQEFFEEQGWTGSIARQDSDYLAVAHSNIGGYKTDKFMDDEIRYAVEIQKDGSIFARLSVQRTHEGGGSKYWWYNRDNIDYLKVYVPEGSGILSYSGGQRREPKNPVDYKKLEFLEDKDVSSIESSARELGPIDIFSESGKTVFGTWLVTKPGKTSVFEMYYKLPLKVEFKNNVAKYNLYLQKQPGTAIRTEAVIDVPENWKKEWSNEGASDTPFVLDKDRVIGYIFKIKI